MILALKQVCKVIQNLLKTQYVFILVLLLLKKYDEDICYITITNLDQFEYLFNCTRFMTLSTDTGVHRDLRVKI